MNLTPSSLRSNDDAVQNCVFMNSTLAKDPNQTVHIKIKDRHIKCRFNRAVGVGKIQMSKNMREYLQVDLAHEILIQPVNLDEKDYTISEMSIHICVRKTLDDGPVHYNEGEFVEVLKERQNAVIFNMGQTFYVQIGGVTYMGIVRDIVLEKKKSNLPQERLMGYLKRRSMVNVKVDSKEKRIASASDENKNTLFREGFKAKDMGIGGLDEELMSIFRRAFVSRRFSNDIVDRFGVKHVKGILLYGPPGTGKTLIARQLSKALNIDEKNYQKVDGPEIFSKFVGESEQNIRKLFANAREDEKRLGPKSPLHVIVFDEIDAICKQRGIYSSSHVNDQVVNQLLSNIDGVDALNNILLIGMTNRKDLLDEAILRPGRFEIHIEVKLPDQKGREQILNIHTAQLQRHHLLGKDCQIDEMARLTRNYTGAEIEALIKSAASYSIMRNTNIMNFSEELKINEGSLRVDKQDFLKAVDEIKPQFGVDDDKFEVHLRERPITYGQEFQRINARLEEDSLLPENSFIQVKSILMYGPMGSGKMTLALNFAKKHNFPYMKVISPFNMIGFSEMTKVQEINNIFESAYKTNKACIIINNIERLLDYTSEIPSITYFSNAVLQALSILIKRVPPQRNCRLLVIGISSSPTIKTMEKLSIAQSFTSQIQVPKLNKKSIQNVLVMKYALPEAKAKSIAKELNSLTFKNLVDIAGFIGQEQWQNPEEWAQAHKQMILDTFE